MNNVFLLLFYLPPFSQSSPEPDTHLHVYLPPEGGQGQTPNTGGGQAANGLQSMTEEEVNPYADEDIGETEDKDESRDEVGNNSAEEKSSKLLTESEINAVLSTLPNKEWEFYYQSQNSSAQQALQRKILAFYGDDLEAMKKAAKDGNISRLLTGDIGGGFETIRPIRRRFCSPYTGRCRRATSRGGWCFSGSSTVQTPHGTISIDALKLNDLVLTFNPEVGSHYTEFLGWLDRSAKKQSRLLKVSTASDASLTLSPSHVIFRQSKAGVLESVPAGELAPGDRLVQVINEGKMLEEPAEVVSVVEVEVAGYWAPLTKEGTLLVNGFLASCSASFSHHLAQVALAPVKMFSTYLLDNEETQHLDGVRDIVKMLKKLGTLFGLRRKVDQGQKKENHLREPRLRSEDLHGAIFEKHTEL